MSMRPPYVIRYKNKLYLQGLPPVAGKGIPPTPAFPLNMPCAPGMRFILTSLADTETGGTPVDGVDVTGFDWETPEDTDVPEIQEMYQL